MGGSRSAFQGWPFWSEVEKGIGQDRSSKVPYGNVFPGSVVECVLTLVQPIDSQHPDRAVNILAIVEKWYTEDEYKAAKERRELAWQDSSNYSTEPGTPLDVRAIFFVTSTIFTFVNRFPNPKTGRKFYGQLQGQVPHGRVSRATRRP